MDKILSFFEGTLFAEGPFDLCRPSGLTRTIFMNEKIRVLKPKNTRAYLGLLRYLRLAFVVGLVSGCLQSNDSSKVSTVPDHQIADEGIKFKPHVSFCSPDRVQTFEVVQLEPTTTFGFFEEQPKVKVRIDLNEEGVVKCDIADCSLTILKPVALDRAIPLGLGVAVNVQLLVQGQKQADQPPEKKIQTGITFTPLNIGIASISVGLAGDYSRWRSQNQQELNDGQLQLKRKLGIGTHVKLGLPTIEVEIGLNNQGIYYRLVGDTALGTKFKLGKVSTRYLESKASIDYRHIPRATLTGMENLMSYLSGAGSSALQGMSEGWNRIRESCRNYFASPCRT
jgi:hypothetical protein